MSWTIGPVTLPIAPSNVKIKPSAAVKSAALLTRSPLLLSFGPETKVLTLNGWLYEAGKTAAQIETDYILPLQSIAEKPAAFSKVIIDDGGVAFWTLVAGTESDDTTDFVKGKNSYKVVLSAQTLDMYHDSDENKDFSKQDFVSVWIKGANSGRTLTVYFYNEVYAAKTNGYSFGILDNFSTWKRFVIRKGEFSNVGSPIGWDKIRCVRILSSGTITGTLRFDRMCVGVGVLVVAPDTRYDGVYLIKEFPYEERGGIVNAFYYQITLWSEDDNF